MGALRGRGRSNWKHGVRLRETYLGSVTGNYCCCRCQSCVRRACLSFAGITFGRTDQDGNAMHFTHAFRTDTSDLGQTQCAATYNTCAAGIKASGFTGYDGDLNFEAKLELVGIKSADGSRTVAGVKVVVYAPLIVGFSLLNREAAAGGVEGGAYLAYPGVVFIGTAPFKGCGKTVTVQNRLKSFDASQSNYQIQDGGAQFDYHAYPYGPGQTLPVGSNAFGTVAAIAYGGQVTITFNAAACPNAVAANPGARFVDGSGDDYLCQDTPGPPPDPPQPPDGPTGPGSSSPGGGTSNPTGGGGTSDPTGGGGTSNPPLSSDPGGGDSGGGNSGGGESSDPVLYPPDGTSGNPDPLGSSEPSGSSTATGGGGSGGHSEPGVAGSSVQDDGHHCDACGGCCLSSAATLSCQLAANLDGNDDYFIHAVAQSISGSFGQPDCEAGYYTGGTPVTADNPSDPGGQWRMTAYPSAANGSGGFVEIAYKNAGSNDYVVVGSWSWGASFAHTTDDCTGFVGHINCNNDGDGGGGFDGDLKTNVTNNVCCLLPATGCVKQPTTDPSGNCTDLHDGRDA